MLRRRSDNPRPVRPRSRGSSTTTHDELDIDPESTASTTGRASTPNGQTAEEEIVARYIGYWDARFAANSGTPNPDDPALRDFATGAQLDAVIAETRSNLERSPRSGLRRTRATSSVADVIDLEGDHAVVQECCHGRGDLPPEQARSLTARSTHRTSEESCSTSTVP